MRSWQLVKRGLFSLQHYGVRETAIRTRNFFAQRPIDAAESVEAIRRVMEVLPQAFLIYGTLLGCIRDGRLIAWDNDVDIGILLEHWEEADIERLRTAGFSIQQQVLWDDPRAHSRICKESMGRSSAIYMTLGDGHSMLGLSILSKGTDSGRYYRISGDADMVFSPAPLVERTTTVRFYDLNVNVPLLAEDFLEFVYGRDWKIPKRRYHLSGEHEENRKRFMVRL